MYKIKLAIHLATIKAIPNNGGIQDGINWLLDQEQMTKDLKQSFEEIEEIIRVVRSAPDNPYEDDEQICKAILDKIRDKTKKK